MNAESSSQQDRLNPKPSSSALPIGLDLNAKGGPSRHQRSALRPRSESPTASTARCSGSSSSPRAQGDWVDRGKNTDQ